MPLDAEDRLLIEAYQQNRDPRAADRIVKKFDRWCRAEARRAAVKFGLEYEDTMQAARLGLMDGVERFELERDSGLLIYAAQWVRRRVRDVLVEKLGGRSGHIVEVRRKVGKATAALHAEGIPVTDEALAARLGCRTSTIASAMRQMVSMDGALGTEDDQHTLHDVLPDKSARRPDLLFERHEHQQHLRRLLEAVIATSLTERRAEIMLMYLDAGCDVGSQSEIASKLGVTRQRIAQVVGEAMPVLEKALRLNGVGPKRLAEMEGDRED